MYKKLTITLTSEELDLIIDWRLKNKVSSNHFKYLIKKSLLALIKKEEHVR